MPPLPFDITINLNAAHLVGTPHEGRPKEAVEAVRYEIEGLPGASSVSVEWWGILHPGVWPLIERLEFIGCDLVYPDTYSQIWAGVEECVRAALQTLPLPAGRPGPVVWPPPPRRHLWGRGGE